MLLLPVDQEWLHSQGVRDWHTLDKRIQSKEGLDATMSAHLTSNNPAPDKASHYQGEVYHILYNT